LIRVDATFTGGITAEDIIDFWVNPPKEKQSMIKELKTLENCENGDQILYMRFKMPLMNDRDNVMKVHFEKLEKEGGTYLKCETVDRTDCPPVKGVVRMY
jgi:hypothetical protein